MKLSIITINLNNKTGLQKTINSVISQSYKDFEWIIIDGGSTDGSKELIEKYSAFISYWISEPDKGIFNAMNKGIKIATGDYFQFLNSGDCLYEEDTIKKFIQRNNTEDVIYGDSIVVNYKGEKLHEWKNPDFLKLSYFFGYGINHQATFIHKRCFEKFLYNENYRLCSDSELFIKLIYHSYTFAKHHAFVAKYDNSGLSSTTKSNEYDEMINNLLPPSVRADYDEIIKFRDVDLAIMIKDIIYSNKLFRHITRIFLYPIYYILKLIM